MKSYEKAILLSPDIIESPFFQYFIKNKPDGANQILNNVQTWYESNAKDNPIYQAKLAKIYLSRGAIKESEKLLLSVTQILPNMNRPWLYLGMIHETQEEREKAKECYKKANFLDSQDPMPCFKLGDIAFHKNQYNIALGYYKEAIRYRAHPVSEHRKRVTRLYAGMDQAARELQDDVVPYGLLSSIEPVVPWEGLVGHLEKIFVEIEKGEMIEKILEVEENDYKNLLAIVAGCK